MIMTAYISLAATSTPGTPVQSGAPADYQAGVCNIGPEEIARRRRAGHVGLAISLALFIGLVVVGAPPILRLVLFLPVAAAASGYLQAWLRFCAGFGSRGIYNFGRIGETFAVPDDQARARDRRKANQLGLAAALIGVVVAIVAVLLPV
jgi:hypothetical protein